MSCSAHLRGCYRINILRSGECVAHCVLHCIAFAGGTWEADYMLCTAASFHLRLHTPSLLVSSILVPACSSCLGKACMCWQAAPAAHSCRHQQQPLASFFRQQHPPAPLARSAPRTAPLHHFGPVQRSAAHPAAPGNAGLSLDPMQTRPCRDCADRSKAAAVPLRRDSGHKARRLKRQPLQMQVVTGAAASRSRLQ